MRIGTWNLEGRWSSRHLALLEGEECDLWLLTEVPLEASIPGMAAHFTAQEMGPGKAWAGVFSSLEMSAQPDPHPATAMAHCEGFRVLSSVLPWRSCGPSWHGATLAEKMSVTLASLREHIDRTTIWGGDWNQALEGPDHVGSTGGRNEILELVKASRLSVPTTTLGSASRGQRSIDHVAVPIGWDINSAHRLDAALDGLRLSDHDAYVVSVDRGSERGPDAAATHVLGPLA